MLAHDYGDTVAQELLARQKLELPLAWFGELPGIGHYPQVEAPDDVAHSYLAFLEKVSG